MSKGWKDESCALSVVPPASRLFQKMQFRSVAPEYAHSPPTPFAELSLKMLLMNIPFPVRTAPANPETAEAVDCASGSGSIADECAVDDQGAPIARHSAAGVADERATGDHRVVRDPQRIVTLILNKDAVGNRSVACYVQPALAIADEKAMRNAEFVQKVRHRKPDVVLGKRAVSDCRAAGD